MKSVLLLALLITTQLSYSKNYAPDIIVGDLDWKSMSWLENTAKYSNSHRQQLINSQAVALLDLGSGGRCTGFMISEDHMMTNEHCISSEFDAEGTKAGFWFNSKEMGPFVVECDEFVMNNEELDYAILKCKESPGRFDFIGKLTLSSKSSRYEELARSYVLHQNCDFYTIEDCTPYKKISYGTSASIKGELILDDTTNEVIYRSLDFVVHDADTLGGSSGSPVFSRNTNAIIALHHVGIDRDGEKDGRGEINKAVPMNLILKDIKMRNPALYSQLTID